MLVAWCLILAAWFLMLACCLPLDAWTPARPIREGRRPASCDRYRCHARGAGNGCEPCFEKILVCNRPEALFWKNLSVQSSGGSVSKKTVVCNRLETMLWQNLTHFIVARMTCLDARRLQRFFLNRLSHVGCSGRIITDSIFFQWFSWIFIYFHDSHTFSWDCMDFRESWGMDV